MDVRQSTIILVLFGLFQGLAHAEPGGLVQFHKRAARSGDISQQQLSCDLALEMALRQAGQTVQARKHEFRRQQERTVTILAATDRGPQAAQVHYGKAQVVLRSDDQVGETPPADQPVTGKVYRVTRVGEELQIRYPDGATPPGEELAVVRANMQTFGLPNPIATYFDGRKVQIGQSLQLPAELARQLLGFPETVQNVTHFGMKLVDVRPGANGLAQATFRVRLLAEDPASDALKMNLQGEMTIEVETCRTLSVNLTGPVSASQTHGPPEGQFQVDSAGDIRVAVKADYRR